MAHSLWHTIRMANGTWPYPFGDVQAQTDKVGPDIGTVIGTACATNQGGDLHVLTSGQDNRLRHTIRLANGTWPYPFGDVQAQTDLRGKDIGIITNVACATNAGGDLHILATDRNLRLWHTIRLENGTWPYPFGDVQAQTHTNQQFTYPSCATNRAGDLHVLVVQALNKG